MSETSRTESKFADWSSKTEEEIFELNSKFISGELKASPYHCAPMCHEFSENLYKINKFHKILTHDGQEGISEKDYKQKPYLSILIDKERFESLLDHLLNHDYIVYFSPDYNDCVEKTPNSRPVFTVFCFTGNKVKEFKKVTYGCDYGEPVTIELNEKGEWKGLTWPGLGNPFTRQLKHLMPVEIVSKHWGSPIKIEGVIYEWILTTGQA